MTDSDTEEQLHRRQQMQTVAVALDRLLNGEAQGADRKTGFVLMVYPFASFAEGDARCNYVSNGADRNDIMTLMKEMIARFDGQPGIKGRA